MAYVIARKDGRFEIRESHTTPRGPRSRTLATFGVLTDAVLEHAWGRARSHFDKRAIRQRAVELGAHTTTGSIAVDARRLITALRNGEQLPPDLAELLRRELPPPAELHNTMSDAPDWIGASDEQRGRTLVDLLDLATRVPRRRRPEELTFPVIRSS
jgi:hypothetical protein